MGLSRTSRPSPAIVVAALALVAALAGTAVAGPDASTSAISKKKVKKIAEKQAINQINELAPGLSVANADTAASAVNANALGGKPAGAYASSASEPYRDVGTSGQPQLQNGWISFDEDLAVGFYKDPLGVVHLKGVLSRNPGNGLPAFTLPPGYRPTQALDMPVASVFTNNQLSFLGVGTNGNVTAVCQGNPACNVGIDGLTFRAR